MWRNNPTLTKDQPQQASPTIRYQAPGNIVGALLFYGQAIDLTVAFALGKLAAAQSKGTPSSGEALTNLLNYV